MEVQAHGNAYEDRVIRERTGMSKKEYDGLKSNGYTSEFDLSKDLVVDYNGSCLLYTSPSPRDGLLSRMPSSA